jgi:hypothetical protein
VLERNEKGERPGCVIGYAVEISPHKSYKNDGDEDGNYIRLGNRTKWTEKRGSTQARKMKKFITRIIGSKEFKM